MQNKQTFEKGATRSKLYERYDLIPPEGIKLIAQRYALGVEQHSENGWKAGGKEFVKATVNHLLYHTLEYLRAGNDVEGQGKGGNLGAIGWAVCSLAWFEIKNLGWSGYDKQVNK